MTALELAGKSLQPSPAATVDFRFFHAAILQLMSLDRHLSWHRRVGTIMGEHDELVGEGVLAVDPEFLGFK